MDRHFVAQGLQADGVRIGRQLQGVHLRLHEFRAPAAVGIAVFIGCQQGIDEGHLSPPPRVAPEPDHRSLQLVVTVLADVGATLIPEETLRGIACDRCHTPVPAGRHAVGPLARFFTQRLDLRKLCVGHAGTFHGRHRHPRLDAASAPGVDDDAHRHVEIVGQAFGEEISHGRSLRKCLAVRQLPAAVHILLDDMGGVRLDVEHADTRRVLRRLQQMVPESVDLLETEAAHRHLHIGLAAAHPDFAEGDIGDSQRFLAATDRHRIGAAGGSGCHVHAPGAVGRDARPDRSPVPGSGDRDGLAGLTPAPDRSRGLALQDHVVGKDVGQAERLRR